jgi:hypothetical protein
MFGGEKSLISTCWVVREEAAIFSTFRSTDLKDAFHRPESCADAGISSRFASIRVAALLGNYQISKTASLAGCPGFKGSVRHRLGQ